MLVTLSLVATLSATAVIFAPRYLNASPTAAAVVAAQSEANQQTIELIANLIGRSVEVMAVRQRGATPYLELVLWLDDRDDAGQVNRGELAVLSHSEILQTVILYELAPDENDLTWQSVPRSGVLSPGFCDAWRADKAVTPRVLATGIAQMQVHEGGQPEAGVQPLQLTLTWAPNSADGSDEASVFVDAAVRPQHVAEE